MPSVLKLPCDRLKKNKAGPLCDLELQIPCVKKCKQFNQRIICFYNLFLFEARQGKENVVLQRKQKKGLWKVDGFVRLCH